jgi:hypothetical protein
MYRIRQGTRYPGCHPRNRRRRRTRKILTHLERPNSLARCGGRPSVLYELARCTGGDLAIELNNSQWLWPLSTIINTQGALPLPPRAPKTARRPNLCTVEGRRFRNRPLNALAQKLLSLHIRWQKRESSCLGG